MNHLDLDDFRLVKMVCEVRYENALLLFDKTGSIFFELQEHFTDLIASSAQPAQSIFISKRANLTVETGLARIDVDLPADGGRSFEDDGQAFFEVVLRTLRVNRMSRIGLRGIWQKDLDSADTSTPGFLDAIIGSTQKVNPLGLKDAPLREFLARWEDSDVGTVFRVNLGETKLQARIPRQLATHLGIAEDLQYLFRGLTIDVDYYTVAAAETSQWKPSEWIGPSFRRIRKLVKQHLTSVTNA